MNKETLYNIVYSMGNRNVKKKTCLESQLHNLLEEFIKSKGEILCIISETLREN